MSVMEPTKFILKYYENTSYRCRLYNEIGHLMVSCPKNVKQEKESQVSPSELDHNGFQRVREEESHIDGYRNIEEKQRQKTPSTTPRMEIKRLIHCKRKVFQTRKRFQQNEFQR